MNRSFSESLRIKDGGSLMPSESRSQQRLMRAAAHTPGGYDGVPQKVGKDYVKADKGRPAPKVDRVKPKAKGKR